MVQMVEYDLAQCIIADHAREAKAYARQRAALRAAVVAGAADARCSVRRRVMTVVGARLIRLGERLGGASARPTSQHV